MTGAASPPTMDPQILARARAAYEECLPRIRNVIAYQHRHLRGEHRSEAMAETEAFVWKAFLRLALKGADPAQLASRIATFEARRVRSGRRFAGKVDAEDIMADEARHRNGHFVTSLPHADKEEVAAEVRDALAHRVPGPAEEAITRLDWQAFLDTLTPAQRGVAEGLESG